MKSREEKIQIVLAKLDKGLDPKQALHIAKKLVAKRERNKRNRARKKNGSS
jgi:hypothetical protein